MRSVRQSPSRLDARVPSGQLMEAMKIGETWTSEPTATGFRVSVELPAGLLVTIQERVATAVAPEGKVIGHAAVWRTHAQVLLFFPTSRVEAQRFLAHTLEHFDPELKQHIEKMTGWLNEIEVSSDAPPAGQGTLN